MTKSSSDPWDPDYVQCDKGPGSCGRKQCCLGSAQTGQKTYPCPNSPAGWNECGTAGLLMTKTSSDPWDPDYVQCDKGPGSCGRKQCCLGSAQTGQKTYPCPNSPAGWNECGTAGLLMSKSSIDQGGPSGGASNGMYQNDFDWKALMKMTGPKCNEVCKGERDQCYPIKKNGFMGPPCGVLSA